MRCRQTIVGWLGSFMLICFIVGISLSVSPSALAAPSRQFSQATDIVEVSPPVMIQKLRSQMNRYQPQVKILSPAADQLLKDNSVSVRFDVKDLPIFKDAKLGLGPHLSVLLDNQPAQEVYDLSQPLVFKDLAPGTHTIRAVATRPWAESFKNPSAFDQTTFHVFTKTAENNPTTDQPLLTYGQPQGVLGTDTVLIDFFLSHLPTTDTHSSNWQAQVSVNGSKFRIDEWQPLYVQGLKPGKNWVQMQLTDRQGRKIDNAFNDTIRIVELKENGNDTLSKLIRGDLSVLDAGGIVDPNYKRPQPPVEAPPSPAPVSPPELTKSPKAEPVPAPVLKQPVPTPKPQAPAPAPKPAPTKPVTPTQPTKPKSPKAQKQTDQRVKPTPPAQKDQKPTADQSQEKAGSPASAPVRIPVKEESSFKAKGTESGKSASTPAKPSADRAEKKPPTSLQKEKAAPPSDLKKPQPQPTDKSSGLEKTAPKPLEESSPAKLDASSKATTKTAVPKPETTKVSPVPSTPTVKAPAPSAPAAKSPTPEPIKEKSPALPNRPEQPKPAQKDEKSALKTTLTKFWRQVRPKPTQSSPSTAGEKAPTQKAEPKSAPSSTATQKVEPKPVPSPATKKIEPKPIPNLSEPSSKRATPSPKKVQPTPSPRSTNQKGVPPAKPKTTTIAPSQRTPGKAQTTTQPKPPAPQPSITQPPKPSVVKPKAAESISKPGVDSPEKPQPELSAPTQKASDSNSSVFSAFRERLQQLQKSAVPTQKPSPSAPSPKAVTSPSSVKPTVTPEPSTTSAKTEASKTSSSAQSATTSNSDNQTKKEPAKPAGESKGKSQPSAFSAFRERWQQQKQLMSPTETAKPAPVQPDSKKTTGTTGAITTPPSQNKVTPARPSPTPAAKKPASQSSAKPSVTKPTVKEPETAKPVEPKSSATAQPDKPQQTDSFFSSLRSKWQLQKQLMSPTEKTEPPPVKPTPQTAGTTGAGTSLPNQNQIFPARPSSTPATQQKPASQRSTPKSMQKPSVTKPVTKEPVQAKPIETQPEAATQPTKAKPTESVFSSLRDRWQQQLNQPGQKTTPSNSPPEGSKPSAPAKTSVSAKSLTPAVPTTTNKSESMKAVSKPSRSSPGLSSPRVQAQQKKIQSPAKVVPNTSQKLSSPKTTDSPKVSPNQPKTPGPKVMTTPTGSSSTPKTSSSSSQHVKKADDALSPEKTQKSESTVFDPGVYYRRFFSGKTANTAPGSEKVSSTPSTISE